jgi:hypothetical protein
VSEPVTDTMPGATLSGFDPEVFGKYYLVDKIATGGMAEIFRAKTYSHGGFQQTLVIKRILKHLGENEDFVEMFVDEAKLSVALQHANIIRIYDFGKLLDNYFIAMEWVDGKDVRNLLRKLAKNGDYVPIDLAAFIAYEACKGLHYAHTKSDLKGQPYNIIHRDVSPSNLLVSYDGDVKVADFGIAKAKSNAGTTDVGIIKGKFDYMSPEQAEGSGRVDHRSDVFALGIVLWEMLAGRRLFKGTTDIETLGRVRAADVDPPSAVNARVPAAFDRVVMKALRRLPDDRYATAEAMAEDLLELMKPENPDQLRQRLGKCMNELFATEIAAERARLDATTDAAAKLHSEAPAPYSAYGTNPTVSRTNAPQGGAAGFVALGVGASMLAVAFAILSFGAIAAVVFWPKPPPPPVPVASTPEVVPTTGSLDVMLLPGGRILVDGEEKGVDEATIALLPGLHKIRVEQAGFDAIEEDVTIVLGQTARFKRTLTPTAKEVPKVTTRVVVVQAPAVEKPPEPVPVPVADGPGKVVVSVQGGGWADVWVDGEKQAKTAPLTLTLPPGKHTIRLQNGELGVDQTDSVDVTAGGTVRVVARPK